jgi:hypothetical protein
MKARLLWLFTVINLILLVSSASAHDAAVTTGAPLAAPFGTSFTYQGRLRSSNRPFNGSCDFQFSPWNALSGGASVAGIVSKNNTPVTDGRFTVELDFGAIFDGNGRWLQIAVRCPTGSGGFTTLTPRQKLNPSPYAVRATAASSIPWSGITGKPAGFADGIDNTVTVPLNLQGTTANPLISLDNSGAGILAVSDSGRAVEGDSTTNYGVAAFSEASAGLFARSTGNTAASFGVFGVSDNRRGVVGLHLPTDGGYWGPTSPAGVVGSSDPGIGVYGSSDTYVGVYGFTNNGAGNYAGYFVGNVNVTGAIAAAASVFRIDHPLDPSNKYLSHASVESSDMKNIYDGVVTLDAKGMATVTLPDWFEAFNQDFRYQLTAIGAPGPDLYIAQEIHGNQFAIAGGKPGSKVSWQITGIRSDAYAKQNRMQIESVKPADQRGKYLHPESYGQPADQRVDYVDQQSEKAQPSQSNQKAP